MLKKEIYYPKGDELLISVFNYFPKEKPISFYDETNIMSTLFEFSFKPKYKDFFENYQFDEDGVYPYSFEIADSLNSLHQTMLLGKLNPSFTKHQLSKGIEIRYEKYVKPKYSDEQIEAIKQLAKELCQSFKVDEI